MIKAYIDGTCANREVNARHRLRFFCSDEDGGGNTERGHFPFRKWKHFHLALQTKCGLVVRARQSIYIRRKNVGCYLSCAPTYARLIHFVPLFSFWRHMYLWQVHSLSLSHFRWHTCTRAPHIFKVGPRRFTLYATRCDYETMVFFFGGRRIMYA